MDRRSFLRLGAFTTAHAAFLGCRHTRDHRPRRLPRLTRSDNQLLDVPEGFSVRVIQTLGDPMTDGWTVGPYPDGMGCVTDAAGNWVLLRNHEIEGQEWLEGRPLPDEAYDPLEGGGVVRVVIDPATREVVSSNWVLMGTDNNCSGGPVPNGWVSCEESEKPGHGYAFLCHAESDRIQPPQRLDSWGRFKREAIALDTRTGVVWMTEDHEEGCLYRHTPVNPEAPYGPGRLEALEIRGLADTEGIEVTPGSKYRVTWVAVEDTDAAVTPCRSQCAYSGAARFRRCEGVVWDGTSLTFVASTAGPMKAGQVWRLTPARRELELVTHVTDRTVLSMPDNLTLSPWGDVIVAEDNYNLNHGCTANFIRGLSRDGTPYNIAADHISGAEFAGICFSPDGSTLFVNQQDPVHRTLAITGPWPA